MTEKMYVKTFLYVWPYVLLVALAIFGIFGWEETLSFFLGSAVSVMLMSHNYKTSMRTAANNPEALKRTATFNAVFRYVFYALILFIAYASEGLDLIFTFVGFTSFKVTLLLTFLLSKKEGGEDDA